MSNAIQDRRTYIRAVGHVIWHISAGNGLRSVCGHSTSNRNEESEHLFVGEYICFDCYEIMMSPPPRFGHDGRPLTGGPPFGIYIRQR